MMADTPRNPRPRTGTDKHQRGLAADIMRRTTECKGDPDFMTSLARGLAVLGAFGQHNREVTLAQLSADTGIPRAAVRRVVHTLGKLGYVDRHGRGFLLKPRALDIGNAYLGTSSLSRAAQPVLDALRDQVHESCSLGILDGDGLLYVARAETVRIMSIGIRPGTRLPAYCTSMGRVLLAALPAETLAGYLERNPLRPRTERTVTDPAHFHAVLERARRAGHALVDQELELGLRSVAVPVHDRHGNVIAALNIGTAAGRVTLAAMQGILLPALREAALRLEPTITAQA